MTLSYDELLVKYPKLYSELSYFETDIGWLNLIDELSQKLEAINNKYEDAETCVYAVQVKQKFGGLRFYVYSRDISEEDYQTCQNLIAEAEKTSYNVCESCGKPASSFKRNFWILTLCKECQEASKSVKS